MPVACFAERDFGGVCKLPLDRLCGQPGGEELIYKPMLRAWLRVLLTIILLTANAAAQNPVKLDRQTNRTMDQQLGDVNQLLEAGRTGGEGVPKHAGRLI